MYLQGKVRRQEKEYYILEFLRLVVAKVSAESPAARKENADTNSILKALK